MKYLIALSVIISCCNAATSILKPAGSQDTPINVIANNYTDVDGTLLQGYLSLPDDIDNNTKRSAVIILHDADGPTDYEKQRASIISSQNGYIGFAADMFGYNVELPENSWGSGQSFMSQFFTNETLFTQRIQAAVDHVQSLDEVDASKVSMIGYCFGGTGIVTYLNNNGEVKDDSSIPVAAAIGVHPSLLDWPSPKGNIDIPALFLTGGADFLTGPEAMLKLETDMEMGSSNSSVNTPWETIRYAKIEHAFSNFYSDRYDARADARSWESGLTFLAEEFGEQSDIQSSPPIMEADVMTVDYLDGIYSLMGYVAMPKDAEKEALLPAVIILSQDMEQGSQLATEQRDMGYIGFSADLDGMDDSNTTEVISRVSATINHVKTMDGVDPNKVALAGFGGIGGTAAIYYAMYQDTDMAIKAISSFQANLNEVANSTLVTDMLKSAMSDSAGGGAAWGGGGGGGGGGTWGGETNVSDGGVSTETPSNNWGNNDSGGRQLSDTITSTPQILIQSGADEDEMENVIKIEQALMSIGANYELSRFSTFDERATTRSMDQMDTLLTDVFSDITTDEDIFPTETTPGTEENDLEPEVEEKSEPVVEEEEEEFIADDSSAESLLVATWIGFFVFGITLF